MFFDGVPEWFFAITTLSDEFAPLDQLGAADVADSTTTATSMFSSLAVARRDGAYLAFRRFTASSPHCTTVWGRNISTLGMKWPWKR